VYNVNAINLKNRGGKMIKAVQYFNFSNALEALEFYEKNFDAVINSKSLATDPMFADALDEMGMSKEDAETFVMNAEFEVLGQNLWRALRGDIRKLTTRVQLLHLRSILIIQMNLSR
jgi:Uncharacterized protein conserved in bacteria